MQFDFSLISDAAATLGRAYGWTIFITVGALVIGIILGTLIAVCKVIPKTNIVAKILDKIVTVYVAIFRGTPLTVQLFIFYFIIFAKITFFNTNLHPYFIAVIGFGLNSAAYVSETIRAGILSVDKGQMEAGRSLGLGYVDTMTQIIMPQAIKNCLPALINEIIALLKETSICGYIGLAELTRGGDIIRGVTFDPLLPLIVVAIVYLIIVMFFTWIMSLVERRLRESDIR